MKNTTYIPLSGFFQRLSRFSGRLTGIIFGLFRKSVLLQVIYEDMCENNFLHYFSFPVALTFDL